MRFRARCSHAFAGQNVGVTVGDRDLHAGELGHFDDETCRLEPMENPFGPKLLPIRSE